MQRNRLRIERNGKKLRLLIDAGDLVAKLAKEWPVYPTDAAGLMVHDLQVQADELLRSARAVQAGAPPDAFDVISCGCGFPACAGILPIEVSSDDSSVTWNLRPTTEEVPPIAFSFDRGNYLSEITRAVPARRDGSPL